MKKFRLKLPTEIEAMQFKTLDDHIDIVYWMKESNDTNALANEVRYTTPIMYMPTIKGFMAANPGDYIIKDDRGNFSIVRKDIFEAVYGKISN